MFSICSRLSPDVVNTNNNAPSLGHFLEVERRAAANIHRRNMIYGPRDFSPILPNSGVNSQFLGDQIAPQSSASLGVDGGRRSNTELLQHGNGYGASLVLSCLCGQLIEWWLPVKHFTCSYVPGFWIIQLQVWEVKHYGLCITKSNQTTVWFMVFSSEADFSTAIYIHTSVLILDEQQQRAVINYLDC